MPSLGAKIHQVKEFAKRGGGGVARGRVAVVPGRNKLEYVSSSCDRLITHVIEDSSVPRGSVAANPLPRLPAWPTATTACPPLPPSVGEKG